MKRIVALSTVIGLLGMTLIVGAVGQAQAAGKGKIGPGGEPLAPMGTLPKGYQKQVDRTVQEALTSAQVTGTSADAALASQIATLMADASVQNATVGTMVAVAGSETIYQRNQLTPVKPASNMKTVTGAAAMDLLGPDFRFVTKVTTEASVSGGVLGGDLQLVGNGDPTLLESDLAKLAADVRAAGITQIGGNLVADASYWEATSYSPYWKPEWYDQYYAPQISALTLAPDEDYDVSTVIVNYVPGALGAPAKLALLPESAGTYVTVVNNTKTGAAGTADTVGITRTSGTNTITLSGSVPLNSLGSAETTTVNKPALFALAVFRAQLAKVGVTVTGSSLQGVAPSGARVVANRASMPLSQLLNPFMKLSNNGIAEHLCKQIGRVRVGDGSWASCTPILADWLVSIGASAPGVTIKDASGLSYDNRLTAQTLITLLQWLPSRNWFAAFETSLPVAGNPDRLIGGTLRNRMVGTAAADNLHAKTGTLTGVTALSGYVSGADGRSYVFSMIGNYATTSTRPVEDKLGVLLASWTSKVAGGVVAGLGTPTCAAGRAAVAVTLRNPNAVTVSGHLAVGPGATHSATVAMSASAWSVGYVLEAGAITIVTLPVPEGAFWVQLPGGVKPGVAPACAVASTDATAAPSTGSTAVATATVTVSGQTSSSAAVISATDASSRAGQLRYLEVLAGEQFQGAEVIPEGGAATVETQSRVACGATETLTLRVREFAAAAIADEKTVTLTGSPCRSVPTPTVERIAGTDRYATAIGVSRTAFPAGPVPVVYVATGDDFPDALAGGAAASHAGGPLLLVQRQGISEDVASELRRLRPERIVVQGGSGVVTDTLLETLRPFATSGVVTRNAGNDRYGTALATSRASFPDGWGKDVYLATGEDYPDALSSGSVYSAALGPVLLVPQGGGLPQAVKDEINRLTPTRVTLLGGPGVVAERVITSDLWSMGYGTYLAPAGTGRLAGLDRYQTSSVIAEVSRGGTVTSEVLVTTGENFPDGLAAGPLAKQRNGMVLLTNGRCWTPEQLRLLTDLQPSRLTLLGGPAVVADGLGRLEVCG